MHPRYHYFYYLNDIAVLELEQDLNLNLVPVRPACLPTQGCKAVNMNWVQKLAIGKSLAETCVPIRFIMKFLRKIEFSNFFPAL